MTYKTEQEAFWAGEFGNEYIGRSGDSPENLAYALAKWCDIIKYVAVSPKSVLELGANIGLNLRALRALLPQAALSCVEINTQAVAKLREWNEAEVTQGSILEYNPDGRLWDMVFTSGVLIHNR